MANDTKFYTIIQNIPSVEYGGKPAYKMMIYDDGTAILEYVYQQHNDTVLSYYMFHGDKANYNRQLLDSVLNTTKFFYN